MTQTNLIFHVRTTLPSNKITYILLQGFSKTVTMVAARPSRSETMIEA